MNKLDDLRNRRQNILQQLSKVEQEIEKESKPQIKDNIDWVPVKVFASSIINDIADGSYHEDDDNEQYLYETVIESIYGKEIWDWMNERIG